MLGNTSRLSHTGISCEDLIHRTSKLAGVFPMDSRSLAKDLVHRMSKLMGVFATDKFGGGNATYKWPRSGLNV